jgi:hypothetical protein
MTPPAALPTISELLKRVKLPPPRDDCIEMEVRGNEGKRPATVEDRQRIRAELDRQQRLLDMANRERPGEKPLTFDERFEEEDIFLDIEGGSTPRPSRPEHLAAAIGEREKFRAWLIKLDQEQNGDRALVPPDRASGTEGQPAA